MNAIVKEFPGEEGTFFRTGVKEPSPGYGQVKIKVMAASICGSDIHALYSGLMQDRYAFPVIIGHEGAGVVVEVGEGVTSIRVGDRVTAETTLTACGTCEYCRQSQTNMCADRKGLGSAADGYFAQFCIAAESACHKLADSLSYEVASLAEPFACAVHATCILADIKPGDVVLVVGPGPIGDLIAITAKLCGAIIVMSGLTADAERMTFARRQFGVDHTVDCQTEDLETFLKSITDGRGADFVFECTGSRAGIQSGLKMCKRKGTYVAVGMNMGEIPVDYYNTIYKKEITIQGDKSTSSITWVRAMRILNSGQVDLTPLITHRIPMSQWKQGYELCRTGKALKVIMLPQEDAQ